MELRSVSMSEFCRDRVSDSVPKKRFNIIDREFNVIETKRFYFTNIFIGYCLFGKKVVSFIKLKSVSE